MRKLNALAVIHYGNYDENGAVVNDKCPCCKWDPWESPEGKARDGDGDKPSSENEPDWRLGELWAPGVERGIGAYFQVFHCQSCGLVYATHLN